MQQPRRLPVRRSRVLLAAVAVAVTTTFVGPGAPQAAPTVLLGDQAVEGNQDSDAGGEAEAFRYTATLSGTARQVWVYLDGANAANRVSLGLYTNSASGNPETLLAQGTITAPTPGAWDAATVPDTAITAGTQYWIAVLAPAGTGTVRYRDRASGGGSQSNQTANLAALPATWSPGSNWPTGSMSAYVTADVAAPTPTPS